MNDDCSNIKKRGRKPKGGKITTAATTSKPISSVTATFTNTKSEETFFQRPNIILHLKCGKNDINKENDVIAGYGHGECQTLSYNVLEDNATPNIFDCFMKINNKESDKQYLDDDHSVSELIDNEFLEDDDNKKKLKFINSSAALRKKEMKELNTKLKILEFNLHINNIANKKSACFWCTCDFEGQSVFIPKGYLKETIQVYGCFCSPECAVGFLMQENIDSSTRYERYSLLNHIYSPIYEYKNSIKPAPCPFHMLDKYFGALTIEEYRNLSKSKTIMIKIDKPITRILPEFHEDNDDYILTSRIISTSQHHTNSVNTNSLKKNKICSLFSK
jgi:hypothetical protein